MPTRRCGRRSDTERCSRHAAMMLVTVLVAGLCGGSLRADEQPATAEQGELPDVEQLAARLDDASFAKRREASMELRRRGAQAFPILLKIAKQGSAEARTRSLEILEQHFREGNPELQQEARRALEQLAEHDSVAGRYAQNVLHPAPVNGPLRIGVPVRVGGPGVVIRGPVIIRPQQAIVPPPLPVPQPAKQGAPRRFEIRAARGAKHIHISSDENGINVTIKTRENGQEKTEQFRVKDFDELKRRSPEAHQIAQQMLPGGGRDRTLQRHIDRIGQQMEETRQRLAEGNAADRPMLERRLESLERLRTQIEELKKR